MSNSIYWCDEEMQCISPSVTIGIKRPIIEEDNGQSTCPTVKRCSRLEDCDSTLLKTSDVDSGGENTNRNSRKSLSQTNTVLKSTASVDKRKLRYENEQMVLLYGSKQIIKLFIPITLCMAVVVTTINSTTYYTEFDQYTAYTPFHDSTADTHTIIWQSLANSFIILTVVIIMTFVLLLLYKYRYYKVIRGWLMMSSVILLFFFSFIYLDLLLLNTHNGQVLQTYNVPMDLITVIIIIWNFGIGGLFSIHWNGPIRLQQAYLVVISALVSLMIIKYMPDWTTWAMLGVLVIWDLIAVLAPKGPLKMLVETAESRNEPIISTLVYSSTMLWQITLTDIETEQEKTEINTNLLTEEGVNDADTSKTTNKNVRFMNDECGMPSQNTTNADILASNMENLDPKETGVKKKYKPGSCLQVVKPSQMSTAINLDAGTSVDHPSVTSQSKIRKQQRSSKKQQNREHKRAHSFTSTTTSSEDNGVHLGLGDFIFYGVLVGKASSYGDWNATLACFIAIQIGLCCTLLLLIISRTAMPALPISLTFGIISYFTTSILVQPFMNRLASEQVYI